MEATKSQTESALVDYKQLLEQQLKANAELTSALEKLAHGVQNQHLGDPLRHSAFGASVSPSFNSAIFPPPKLAHVPAINATVSALKSPLSIATRRRIELKLSREVQFPKEKDKEKSRSRSCPVSLDQARTALVLHGSQLEKQQQLDTYCETYLHRTGRSNDGQTVFSVGVVVTSCLPDRLGVLTAKLLNGDVGEYTYGQKDLIGDPFEEPAAGDLVYFIYANHGPKDVRTASLVIPLKLQSASLYKSPMKRERGLVLRVMRHQGGVYIGTAYDNIVMFAPFRAVVHPCQYTRRGDQVEFNIPANYVPPKDTNSLSFTEGLVNVCVVPPNSLWEGTLSEEKIVGYVSRVPSASNQDVGLVQYMDEKRVNPDQTLQTSYIAFTPKDVNYDHSSLVKLNHKVSFRILTSGDKRPAIAVNIGIEEGLEKFRGHIVAVCNGYGFIEHEHLTDIWFHFTRLRPGVDGRKLRIGTLVEYSLLPQKPDRSGLQACQVQPLLHQYLSGYARLEDDTWNVGVVERALRNTNPAQSQYHGLVRTRINDQDEVYLFSMSGVVRKYEILQVGDRVKFQIGLDGQTTLRRAVNIIRTVYVLQVKTLRSDGEFGFLFFGGQDLFFHSSQIRNRMRPHQGDWVECALAKDRHGRLCASSLRILHPREMTRELYERAASLNPRAEGDFPRPHIQPKSGLFALDRGLDNMEDVDLEHSYGSSGQPRSHNVPRDPYWLVVVPELFRDACRTKTDGIKVPKSLYEVWLNGMATNINFQPPKGLSVGTAHASVPQKIGGELGDFQRSQVTDIDVSVELPKRDQMDLPELSRLFSSPQAVGGGDKGDNSKDSLMQRSTSSIHPGNWLTGSTGYTNIGRGDNKEARVFVRATKSNEFHLGRDRPAGRF